MPTPLVSVVSPSIFRSGAFDHDFTGTEKEKEKTLVLGKGCPEERAKN
jgi:hypothetical protein